MKNLIILPILILLGCVTFYACAQKSGAPKKNPYYDRTATEKLNVPDNKWQEILTPGVYNIAREEGTERAYTGKNWNNHDAGNYYCAVCGNLLYYSNTKFESGTGWPSFYQPAKSTSVTLKTDADGSRTEVECARCGSHLGHVFDDGPLPTRKRYCMNGAVMDFEKK